MLRDRVSQSLLEAVRRLAGRGVLPETGWPAPEVEAPKQAEHGDLATNWALVAAKSAGTNPRALAEALVAELAGDATVARAEVAGPGFVNLVLTEEAVTAARDEAARPTEGILADPAHFGRPAPSSEPLGFNVEFVSVNPNGPITIGSGRGAAYGSTLCNVLEASGHGVHREYYINDGVNSEQMRLFAESVQALLAGQPVPDNGYKGDYVAEVAKEIALDAAGAEGMSEPDVIRRQCEELMVQAQREDLEAFGVTFDTWFSEQSLHDSGVVTEWIDRLVDSQVADDRPVRTKVKFAKGGVMEEVVQEPQAGGDDEDATTEQTTATLWLRSTLFGDDMDRVLRRRDGRLTYIASDVAYHADKFSRGSTPDDQGDVRPADRLITVLGPDHHGYIGRLHAVVAADLMAQGHAQPATAEPSPLTEAETTLYGSDARRDACQAALAASRERLTVQIFQLVRFLKDGKPAPMRKRDGNIYALIDLIREIGQKVRPDAPEPERLAAGKDVARFFYLMRHHDTTFDFDLDLAEKQSDENPVFYVQYAHARICGVLRTAAEAGIEASSVAPGPLHPKERTLLLKVADLPNEVRRCAEDFGVNRLATYAIELARTYHHFYDACRVVDPADPATSASRVQTCLAAQSALRGALELLGVSAPERM